MEGTWSFSCWRRGAGETVTAPPLQLAAGGRRHHPLQVHKVRFSAQESKNQEEKPGRGFQKEVKREVVVSLCLQILVLQAVRAVRKLVGVRAISVCGARSPLPSP